MKVKHFKYILLTAAVGLMMFFAADQATSAYLGKSPGELNNVITAGSARAILKEEHWEPENAKQLHPGQTVSKDPAVENTGKNEIRVFLKVEIPVKNIALVDQKYGRKTEPSKQELFSMEPDLKTWQFLSENTGEDKKEYIYGYKKILKPGETTTPLFQKVTAVSYLEGAFHEDEVYTIPVIAEVIQAGTQGKSLEEIYREFCEQYDSDSAGGKA